MSVESAKAFLEKVKEEPSFQEQFETIDSEEKFFDVVKSAGFDFTKEDCLEMIQENSETGEVHQDALKQVSGGATVDEMRCWCNLFLSWPTFCLSTNS